MAEITDILQRLIARTEAGKVPWQITSDDQTFMVVYNNLSAIILIDDVRDKVLKIVDSSGNEIERLDEGTQSGREWRLQLSDLHQLARRSALGVERKLSDLLSEIERDEIDDLPF